MFCGADLNQLEAYDLVPRLPYVQPRYYPAAPREAQHFEVYRSEASQLGVTTLDTYVAPNPPGYQSYYAQKATAGNGIVLYGNAPTSGIYTGVQQE